MTLKFPGHNAQSVLRGELQAHVSDAENEAWCTGACHAHLIWSFFLKPMRRNGRGVQARSQKWVKAAAAGGTGKGTLIYQGKVCVGVCSICKFILLWRLYLGKIYFVQDVW